MTDFDYLSFMRDWRASRHMDGTKISQREYDLVLAAIEGKYEAATWNTPERLDDPDWIRIARTFIGETEIPGPRHNSWIAKGWARLGAGWFTDDETPWCGWFVAHCIDAAGLAYPKPSQFPRAKAWLDWGKPCGETYGAVAVFGRTGGGHVGFLVGQSTAHLYILGGNQSNAVNIMPIARSRLLGCRWPTERALVVRKPPLRTGGTVSRNEA